MAAREDLLAIPGSDGPDYAEAARRFGPEILPHLEALITGEDPELAMKAASLAGMIAWRKAATVLRKASRIDDPQVSRERRSVRPAYGALVLCDGRRERVENTDELRAHVLDM